LVTTPDSHSGGRGFEFHLQKVTSRRFNYPIYTHPDSSLIRSALFRNFTHRRMAAPYRRFRTTYTSIFNGQAVQENCLTLDNGTDSLSRNVGTNYLSTLRNPPPPLKKKAQMSFISRAEDCNRVAQQYAAEEFEIVNVYCASESGFIYL